MKFLKALKNVRDRHFDAYKIVGDELCSLVNSDTASLDAIERSYRQYKLFKNAMTISYRIFFNLCCILLYPLLFLYVKFFGCYLRNMQKEYADGIFAPISRNRGIFPSEQYSSKEIVTVFRNRSRFFLDSEVLAILQLVRQHYPHDAIFLFYALYNLAFYGYITHRYDTPEIIATYESSFTSSLLTEYCHRKGIMHTNVMHGEKLYLYMNAFFTFDKCFVWDSYYQKLFTDLRAGVAEYIVYNPFKTMCVDNSITVKTVDFCFYCTDETEESVAALRDIVQRLVNMQKKVLVRPHPRGNGYKYMQKYHLADYLENPAVIDIYQSMYRAQHIVSVYSTVLFQAYSLGMDIIIDDVSRPQMMERLIASKYIMLSKPHKKLSAVLQEYEA